MQAEGPGGSLGVTGRANGVEYYRPGERPGAVKAITKAKEPENG